MGKIIHHDLKSDGTISYYDMQINKNFYRNIPARFVESVKETHHEHEEKE